MYRPSCPFGARLKAKEFEKGKINISPNVINKMLITKIPAQVLINKIKKLIAMNNEPQVMIRSLCVFFLSKMLTIGISKKKIRIPFNDNKSPL